jgi:hypothetical protein
LEKKTQKQSGTKGTNRKKNNKEQREQTEKEIIKNRGNKHGPGNIKKGLVSEYKKPSWVNLN